VGNLIGTFRFNLALSTAHYCCCIREVHWFPLLSYEDYCFTLSHRGSHVPYKSAGLSTEILLRMTKGRGLHLPKLQQKYSNRRAEFERVPFVRCGG
jgi:hypothetical protein